MTDFESDSDCKSASTLTKSTHISDSLSEVNVIVHALVCQQFFSRLEALKCTHGSNTGFSMNASHSLFIIYQDAGKLLSNLIASGSLNTVLPPVRFMDSSYDALKTTIGSSSCFSSATSLIQDLILVTSYLCSNVLEQSKQAKLSGQSSPLSMASSRLSLHSSSQRSQSVTATLISLAPYWAIASLVTQLKDATTTTDSDVHAKDSLKAALANLLRTPLALRACCDMSDDCLQRLAVTEHDFLQTLAPTKSSASTGHQYLHHQLHILQQQHQDSVLLRLTTRLRKALRAHLHHPLLFCLVLSLSLRSDLSAKARLAIQSPTSTVSATVALFQKILAQSDANSMDITELVITSAPKLVLRADNNLQQATPLIYVTAHRAHSTTGADSERPTDLLIAELGSSQSLTLGLTQLLTEYVPSALTVCDHKGMYPLHFAARRGYSAVMMYLASRFGGFTLSLLDNAGKYPLHHALLSHQLHSEEDIFRLASLCPHLLGEGFSALYESDHHHSYAANSHNTASANTTNIGGDVAFKPLHYAKKISIALYTRLSDCLSHWQEEQRALQYPFAKPMPMNITTHHSTNKNTHNNSNNDAQNIATNGVEKALYLAQQQHLVPAAECGYAHEEEEEDDEEEEEEEEEHEYSSSSSVEREGGGGEAQEMNASSAAAVPVLSAAALSAATSSLQFFAQSLLMLQHDPTTTSTNNNKTDNNDSKLTGTKRARSADIEYEEETSKKLLYTKDASHHLDHHSHHHVDGLTSGDSSVVSEL